MRSKTRFDGQGPKEVSSSSVDGGGKVGYEMKTVSLKLNEQTMRQVDDLQNAFAPFTENRSQTFRVAVEIMHSLVFTKGTLKALVDRLQGMLRNNSYFQMEFEFPSHAAPGTDAGLSDGEIRRPRVVSISRRLCVELETATWAPPSLRTYMRGSLAC
jgi:hypothetical protein